MKVRLENKDLREMVIKNAAKMKNKTNPWNKVFINRDYHPVSQKEYQRLRKKMIDLKKKPGFEHSTGRVKIVNGELQVDGVTVDKNTFL